MYDITFTSTDSIFYALIGLNIVPTAVRTLKMSGPLYIFSMLTFFNKFIILLEIPYISRTCIFFIRVKLEFKQLISLPISFLTICINSYFAL